MGSWDLRISAIAALGEPTRRGLYEYVRRQMAPVSRDEAAEALGLPRSTAAFHLDRLVAEGLLDAVFHRRTDRSGPGAGRPAKLYQRSRHTVELSLPERRYEVAARLLAAAIDHAAHSAGSARAALDQQAYRLGCELGEAARGTGDQDARDLMWGVLEEYGFEPRTEGSDVVLANCPFHLLAREYTELVCGMNKQLIDGLLDGLGPTGLTADLRRSPLRCCVRIQPAS